MTWLVKVTIRVVRFLLFMVVRMARQAQPGLCGGMLNTADEDGAITIPCVLQAGHPGNHCFGDIKDGMEFWRVPRMAGVAIGCRARANKEG